MGIEKKQIRSEASMELAWEVAKRRLLKILPSDVAKEWIGHFELSRVAEEKLIISYEGKKDPSEFLETYSKDLSDCLSWAAGQEIEWEIERKQKGQVFEKTPEKKERKKLLAGKRKKISGVLFVVFAGFFTAIVLIGTNILNNLTFKETFYQVGSGKVDGNLRVIQISDLHNTEFGRDNQNMIKRISQLSPDILVLSGDIIDEKDSSMGVTVNLCRELTKIAPVYYIYGNNEATKIYGIELRLDLIDEYLGCTEENRDSSRFQEKEDDLKTMLEAEGVHVLLNNYDTLEVNGLPIDIYGVLTSNPYAFWPYAGDSYSEFIDEKTDHLKLLVSHEPYVYETYGESHWADLVLCGHTHGGVVRLPYLGAVYEWKNGWFPERKKNEYYVSGKYDIGGYPLIVSNGLSNRGAVRINNQPELVIIDINRY